MRLQDVIIRHHRNYDTSKIDSLTVQMERTYSFFRDLQENTRFGLISIYYGNTIDLNLEYLMQRQLWDSAANAIVWNLGKEPRFIDIAIWFKSQARYNESLKKNNLKDLH